MGLGSPWSPWPPVPAAGTGICCPVFSPGCCSLWLGLSNKDGACKEMPLLCTSSADRALELTPKIPLNPALTVALETTLQGRASAKEKATGKALCHPKSTAEVSNKYHLELSCRPAAIPFRCRTHLTYRTAAANLGRLPVSREADRLHLQKILAVYSTPQAGGSMYKLITCLRQLDIFLN